MHHTVKLYLCTQSAPHSTVITVSTHCYTQYGYTYTHTLHHTVQLYLYPHSAQHSTAIPVPPLCPTQFSCNCTHNLPHTIQLYSAHIWPHISAKFVNTFCPKQYSYALHKPCSTGYSYNNSHNLPHSLQHYTYTKSALNNSAITVKKTCHTN